MPFRGTSASLAAVCFLVCCLIGPVAGKQNRKLSSVGDGWFPEVYYVGLWDILYFPLLGLRGSYLLISFKSFKSPT